MGVGDLVIPDRIEKVKEKMSKCKSVLRSEEYAGRRYLERVVLGLGEKAPAEGTSHEE